jgi:hypothetical protein
LRDVRDTTARHRKAWRPVAMAGMASGDGTALIPVRHPGLSRGEITDVLGRRWPDLLASDVGAAEPTWSMPIDDVVELAPARRGVEPLRIVVLPQRCSAALNSERGGISRASEVEPMPWTF